MADAAVGSKLVLAGHDLSRGCRRRALQLSIPPRLKRRCRLRDHAQRHVGVLLTAKLGALPAINSRLVSFDPGLVRWNQSYDRLGRRLICVVGCAPHISEPLRALNRRYRLQCAARFSYWPLSLFYQRLPTS
jgi:hypothetical protein